MTIVKEANTILDPEKVRAAIGTVAAHGLHKRLRAAAPDEAHRLMPLIWPVIEELCLITDACEANMVEVRG